MILCVCVCDWGEGMGGRERGCVGVLKSGVFDIHTSSRNTASDYG